MSESSDAGDWQGPPDDADGTLQGLVDVLDLRREDDNLFTGQSQPQPWGRVFGGQVLGQSLIAAGRTVDPQRAVHSMHGYFLRPGDSAEEIQFAVDRLRDGRSFSARRVHAIQFGQPILSMIASFQLPAEGMDHQDQMPAVPDPETLPTAADVLAGVDHPAARYWARSRPLDLRHVEQPIYLTADPRRQAHQSVWMKAMGAVPPEPLMHAAILAYASDYTLLESVLREHGVAWSDPRLRAASLDHAMWWHRPVQADDWLLYTQASPSASGGRGLGVGRIFNRDGALVASVGQEGMLRLRDAVSSVPG